VRFSHIMRRESALVGRLQERLFLA
jgi:hypothetical protein